MTAQPRATLKHAVDRFPHALVEQGAEGTVITYTPNLVQLQLDDPYPGLDEWDNCLHWYPGMDPHRDEQTAIDCFREDVETDANPQVWFDTHEED
jgi:hypothetical protein